jgi:hypothetical protein
MQHAGGYEKGVKEFNWRVEGDETTRNPRRRGDENRPITIVL